MKLKYPMMLFGLLGIGLFAGGQTAKKAKTATEEIQEMPVTVKGTKKGRQQPPPPPVDKNGKPLPPPKVEMVKFTPPAIKKDVIKEVEVRPELQFDKNGKPIPPPPPPPKRADEKVKKVPPPPPPPVEKKAAHH